MDSRLQLEAAQQLVQLYPRLRRFAIGLSGSVSDGEDLLHAACERALEHVHQWQPGSRFDSWMYRIIQNLRINRLRSERLRGDGLEPVDAERQKGGDLTQELESQLTLDSVRVFMDRLPVDQRAVMLLICVEGMSYADAASTLGLPVGTVTSRLGRGRRALREFVEQTQPATTGHSREAGHGA